MLLASKNLMTLSSEVVLLKGGHVTVMMADAKGLASILLILTVKEIFE